MVAAGIAVAGEVEPWDGHAFAEVRGGEEAVDGCGEGGGAVLGGIGDEGVDFCDAGGETGEVERDAAEETCGVFFRGVLETGGGETGADKGVDGCGGVGYLGDGDRFDGLEGPVAGPCGAVLDPAFKEVLVGWGELFGFVWRGHDVVGVMGGDAAEEFAVFWVAGDDGGVTGFGFAEGGFLDVEAEVAFAFVGIGAVAGEAVFGENGADFACEVDLLGGDGEREERKEREGVA